MQEITNSECDGLAATPSAFRVLRKTVFKEETKIQPTAKSGDNSCMLKIEKHRAPLPMQALTPTITYTVFQISPVHMIT